MAVLPPGKPQRFIYGQRGPDSEKQKPGNTEQREYIRKQRHILEEFAAHDLLLWYRLKKLDIPDDEYDGV
jgi:hypothetical protein